MGATFAGATALDDLGAGCFDDDGRPARSPSSTGRDACDLFTLYVDVQPEFWASNTGRMYISVAEARGIVGLYVYERQSDGTRGRQVALNVRPLPGQSVNIVVPSGAYYVVVSAKLVPYSSYIGTATFEFEPAYPADLRPLLHDVSEPLAGIDIYSSTLLHERIPAPDALPPTTLDSWVVVPNVQRPVPLVLQVTPYYGGGPPVGSRTHELGEIAEQFVPRGYAYGIVSVRGTGNSGGCFTIAGPSEARDTAAAIEYLAHRPWSNGRVGLIGLSYPGTTPQDVWVEAPPSLKAIVPVSGKSDLYKFSFVNGIPIPGQAQGTNALYLAATGLSPAGINGGAQWRDGTSVPEAVVGEACAEQVVVQEKGLESSLLGDKDAYWQARDFLAELRASPPRDRAAVFYVHGLNDWVVNPQMMDGWLEAVQATGVPFKAWLGQWGHEWPTRSDWWTVVTAWFDQFLKERDTGILDAPQVQVQDDSRRWRHEDDWPPSDAVPLRFYPDGNGRLGETPGGGSAGYYDLQGCRFAPLLRVEFVSEPLTSDLNVAGMPRFQGDVMADGHRASLLLSLVEMKADGTERAFNWAALSLNHARDLSRGEPNIAGVSQPIGLNFFPQDNVLRAGSRIRLIAAAHLYDFPRGEMLPASTCSRITIDLGSARLTLPVDPTIVPE